MSRSKKKSEKEKAEVLKNDAFLEAVADRFKLLGEPMRLKLLRALFDSERTVSELVEETQATQANISRHLSTLAKGGILTRRKEGLNVYYAIEDPNINKLCEVVCTGMIERREQIMNEWSQ